MVLKLYNTLTREKEEFKPLEEGKVKFYSCGQTIYDDLHIGNARAYSAWDTLKKYLKYKGYDVRHIQNITDVGHLTDDGDQGEDKVEKRAKKLDLEPMELVETQIARYFEDTLALNIDRQDIVPRATGHINEMIHYIKRILENGYAYEVDGNVYFDMDKFLEDYPYGEMAKKDIEQLKEDAESRVEPDEKKKNQYDFALWINAPKEHLMKWESPWSTGYPGWHLECSVMSQKYLGDNFDIHAGGKDHIFPHHPNERAQCFAATGEGQAEYWLHNEFIQVEGEKMSKSEGNFYTVRELIDDGYSGDSIRWYLISAHYRSETEFSLEGLEKAEKEVRQVKKVLKRLENIGGSYNPGISGFKNDFETAMDNDLNTGKAKQVLLEFVNQISSDLEEDKEPVEETYNIIKEFLEILGISTDDSSETESEELIELIVEARDQARENEDYEVSDFIRDRLKELGIEVEDREKESKWFRI